MRKSTPVMKLRNAVSAACKAIGLPDDAIIATPTGLSIPDAGIVVSLAISDNKRVWRATARYLVRTIEDDDFRSYSAVLSEEPLDAILPMAKRVAMKLAESRIDYALDEAAEA